MTSGKSFKPQQTRSITAIMITVINMGDTSSSREIREENTLLIKISFRGIKFIKDWMHLSVID